MELSDAAEKARSRTSVSNLQANFRRWRLMCPNASRPLFREIPVQKAGGFLPEFPTTERGRWPLERFLRWPMVVLLMIGGNCSLFASKPAHISRHLPLVRRERWSMMRVEMPLFSS